MPVLAQAEVASSWAGLRPGSPDGMPVIGRFPGSETVFVAGGHFPERDLLAPVTGRLMTQLICNGGPEIDLRPFRPECFG